MKFNAMNGIFAGKAMGVKSNIPTEEELQHEYAREHEQYMKKRNLFKQGSGTFDTSKILGSSTGKSFNTDKILGKSKKSNFDIHSFLNTRKKGESMKKNNYSDKLKQFGIGNTNKVTNMSQKLNQFGIGNTNKKINITQKFQQFGIGKINKSNKFQQFGIGKINKPVNVNAIDKIKQFTGMNLKTGVRSLQNRATVKGINNTEMYGWNRIKQQKGLNPLGDFDGDKLVNMLDCNPRNKYKQGPMHNEDENFYPMEVVNDDLQTEDMINVTPTDENVVEYTTTIEQPEEGVYTDTTENQADLNINLTDVGGAIKRGLGTATKYVGSTIADKYNKYTEAAKIKQQEKEEEKMLQKEWEKKIMQKAQEEALKQKFKQEVQQKIKDTIGKSTKREPIRSKIVRGIDTVDKFNRGSLYEVAAGFNKSARAYEGAMGIPLKEPSKIRQLIGGSSSGYGMREMAGQSGIIPFSTKVEIVAGRSSNEPFPAKVAAVTGKTGLEPRESFPLKVDYYISGGKRREELLEQEKGIYEKLKEQATLKKELQEQEYKPIIPESVYTPVIQTPISYQDTNITSSISPTGSPPQPGMEWSEKSKRWVRYKRRPYNKYNTLPQQTY